jgi:hypothetical protein
MRHPVETSVAVAASLVAVAFTMSTFERWLSRRPRPRHELAWTAALAMFAVAAAALAAGAQAGWSGTTFRVFYLFGAIVNVPFLALGTVYLLSDRHWGDAAAVGVGLFAAFAAGVVVVAPFRAPLPTNELVQGSKVFGPLPRVLAAVGSAGGAMVIFAGAVWSAWRARARASAGGEAGRLVWSNGMIALGTLILAGSGTLNSVFGAMTAFSLTLLVGIVVIFTGFLLASASVPTAATGPPIPPAEPWRPPVSRAGGSGGGPAVSGGPTAPSGHDEGVSQPDRAGAPART